MLELVKKVSVFLTFGKEDCNFHEDLSTKEPAPATTGNIIPKKRIV
jgi:hypothetical protein